MPWDNTECPSQPRSDIDYSHVESARERLRYTSLRIGKQSVLAMLDSGCNINIISSVFYDRLPSGCKSEIDLSNAETITVANNAMVKCLGSATIFANFLLAQRF